MKQVILTLRLRELKINLQNCHGYSNALRTEDVRYNQLLVYQYLRHLKEKHFYEGQIYSRQQLTNSTVVKYMLRGQKCIGQIYCFVEVSN